MPCPLWGNGDLWGSGSLWCRQFGALPYITEIDDTIHRLSIKVNYAGAVDCRVDSIRPNIDWGRSNQDWTYNADIDHADLERISVKVNFSSAVSFKIFHIIPVVNVKKHQPVG